MPYFFFRTETSEPLKQVAAEKPSFVKRKYELTGRDGRQKAFLSFREQRTNTQG
jgi:hypothetical protein